MSDTNQEQGLKERELFLKALERDDPAERAGFLDGACGTDLKLKERVEDLLSKVSPDSFLEKPAVSKEETLLAPEVRVGESKGSVVGRYKLLQQIGEGGMGIVYMAEQQTDVRRKVALKIIKLGMDTKQVIARFEAERQALAIMDHPNIAKVLDAGTTASGLPYFVMELVKGIPITEFCDKNKSTTSDRLKLFSRVCQAIQHAHRKGIIHRDIKPGNILVTLHDGKPVPKVIDFGIAKATNQRLTEKTLFTNFAQLIGTPAYMSPEQAEMSGLDVDTRTDVYSLGVLLYELLTGTTPFEQKDLLSKGYGEMQRIIAEQEPERPSLRMSTMDDQALTTIANHRGVEATTLSHTLKGDLDWIIMKALEKDRARRYDSPNDFLNDIGRHLTNKPVGAAAPSFGYQAHKFYRRNRVLVTTVVAFTLLLLVGSAISIRFGIIANAARERAESETLRANQNEKTALAAQAEANANRLIAEKESHQNLLRAYSADLNFAWAAWNDDDLIPNQILDRWSNHPELQHFEYTRLKHLARPEFLATMPVKQPFTIRIHWHPNSRHFFTASSRGRLILKELNPANDLRLWDSVNGTELPLNIPNDFGWCLEIHKDGKHLITQHGDEQNSLWIRNGASISKIRSKIDGWAVWFADDNNPQRIFTMKWKGEESYSKLRKATIKLLDLKTNTEQFEFDFEFDGPLNLWWMDLSADGSTLVIRESENRIGVWDTTAKRRLGEVSAGIVFLNGIGISKDARLLSVGNDQGEIRTWEINRDAPATERLTRIGPILQGHTRWICNLEHLSVDPPILASGSGDSTIRYWDILEGKQIRKLRGHVGEVAVIEPSPDGTTLASVGLDGTIHTWPLGTRDTSSQLLLPPRSEIAPSRDGSTLISVEQFPTSNTEGTTLRIRRLDLQTLDERESESQLRLDSDLVGIRLSRYGDSLATVNADGDVQWWDLKQRKRIQFGNDLKRIRYLDPWGIAGFTQGGISGDGKTLAIVTVGDLTIQVWRNLDGEANLILEKTFDHTISNAALSHDGQTLAVGRANRFVSIWDLNAGALLTPPFQAHDVSLAHIEFSADDTILITSGDNSARLWSMADFRLILNSKAGQHSAHSVALSDDNRRLAVTATEGSTQIWDVVHQHLVGTMPHTGPMLYRQRFTPDGKTLIGIGHLDGQRAVQVWRTSSIQQ